MKIFVRERVRANEGNQRPRYPLWVYRAKG